MNLATGNTMAIAATQCEHARLELEGNAEAQVAQVMQRLDDLEAPVDMGTTKLLGCHVGLAMDATAMTAVATQDGATMIDLEVPKGALDEPRGAGSLAVEAPTELRAAVCTRCHLADCTLVKRLRADLTSDLQRADGGLARLRTVLALAPRTPTAVDETVRAAWLRNCTVRLTLARRALPMRHQRAPSPVTQFSLAWAGTGALPTLAVHRRAWLAPAARH